MAAPLAESGGAVRTGALPILFTEHRIVTVAVGAGATIVLTALDVSGQLWACCLGQNAASHVSATEWTRIPSPTED